jgi:hypothetical protein
VPCRPFRTAKARLLSRGSSAPTAPAGTARFAGPGTGADCYAAFTRFITAGAIGPVDPLDSTLPFAVMITAD